MRNLIIIVCGALLLSAQAAPSPIIAHYRAYDAALQRGDLAAAESEASEAYDASVAQDGVGGRTGVLAANLAKIRLHNGHVSEAYAPAQRAFEIGASNPAAGVDPLLARLLLGRAELTALREDIGRQRLMAALEEATSHPELGADAYDAAVQLAIWFTPRADFGLVRPEHRDPAISADAWAYAGRFAEFASTDHQIALAEARIGEAAMRILWARDDRTHTPDSHQVSAVLDEAGRILGPLAAQRAGNELTIAQRDYALAMAWRRFTGPAQAAGGPFSFVVDEHGAADPRNYCQLHVIPDPMPTYPNAAVWGERQGLVILRVLFDANGRTADVRVGAALPEAWFKEAVERVASHWRVEPADEAEPGCVMPPMMFPTVVFRMPN